ncbi:amidohydrolase [Sphingopyxis sp. GW247-27LB]|uniref:amidohydrolase n=1 Tax=Sphingopyxis sp. GW247-27LB TaxID=2012632 RepID=UPI000BA76D13|nr:amidohydrolase [Sphingopyxis sp. GW247-27LB]PAL20387.1 peptidase M20 [Sphingopyxis sp. GW247-27LB]
MAKRGLWVAASLALSLAATGARAAPDMAAANARLSALLDKNYPALEAIYKDLHLHPELGMQEVRTAGILAQQLRKAGFAVTEKVGGTGVVGVLKNGDGPTILVRADMDALPLEEKTGLAWASKARATYEGKDVPVMHACGHDTHVAYLVGVAQALSAMRDSWSGTVVLIGQPAEETLKGARAMLDDGLLTRFPKPDFGFAAHVSNLPSGVVAIKAGPSSSASDSYSVIFHGRGGHGSMPAATIDPIPIAARFVTDAQVLISREKDPAAFGVLTVGAIHAGSAPNIIPDSAEVKVNLRSQSPEVRDLLRTGTARAAKAAAAMGNAPEPTVTYLGGTGVLMNDEAMAASAAGLLGPVFGKGLVFAPASAAPLSGSEDYSEYVEAGVPSVFFGIGGYDPAVLADLKAKGEPAPTNHSPFFAPQAEPAIRNAVTAIVLSIIGGVRPAAE